MDSSATPLGADVRLAYTGRYQISASLGSNLASENLFDQILNLAAETYDQQSQQDELYSSEESQVAEASEDSNSRDDGPSSKKANSEDESKSSDDTEPAIVAAAPTILQPQLETQEIAAENSDTDESVIVDIETEEIATPELLPIEADGEVKVDVEPIFTPESDTEADVDLQPIETNVTDSVEHEPGSDDTPRQQVVERTDLKPDGSEQKVESPSDEVIVKEVKPAVEPTQHADSDHTPQNDLDTQQKAKGNPEETTTQQPELVQPVAKQSETQQPIQQEHQEFAPVAPAHTDRDSQQNGRNSQNERQKWYLREAPTIQNADGAPASTPNPVSPANGENLQSATQVGSPESIDASLSTSIQTSSSTENASTLNTTTTVHNIVPAVAAAATTSVSVEATTDNSANSQVNAANNRASEARPTDQPATADNSKQTDGLTQQERVRLVQRIARSFGRLGPTGGQINLRLHPPQLGALNVQVRLEGRDMAARLTTETAAARDVILESLPVLRGRLAEQGFEVSQFQVDVADNSGDASLAGGNSEAHSQQQGGRRPNATSPPLFRSAQDTSDTVDELIASVDLDPDRIDLHA